MAQPIRPVTAEQVDQYYDSQFERLMRIHEQKREKSNGKQEAKEPNAPHNTYVDLDAPSASDEKAEWLVTDDCPLVDKSPPRRNRNTPSSQYELMVMRLKRKEEQSRVLSLARAASNKARSRRVPVTEITPRGQAAEKNEAVEETDTAVARERERMRRKRAREQEQQKKGKTEGMSNTMQIQELISDGSFREFERYNNQLSDFEPDPLRIGSITSTREEEPAGTPEAPVKLPMDPPPPRPPSQARAATDGGWKRRPVARELPYIARERERYRNSVELRKDAVNQFKEHWKLFLWNSDNDKHRVDRVDDPPHDCADLGCVFQRLDIRVYAHKEDGKMNRHVCAGEAFICPTFNDITTHNSQWMVCKISNICVCYNTGVIHECESGCVLAKKMNQTDMEIMCPVSGIPMKNVVSEYKKPRTDAEFSDFEVRRNIFYSNVQEQKMIRQRYCLISGEQPEVFGVEEDADYRMLDKAVFKNGDEYRLYELRLKLARFFSKKRIAEELRNSIENMLLVCKDICVHRSKKKADQQPVHWNEVQAIPDKYKPDPLVANLLHMSRNACRRLITYYAYLCFVIWKQLCERWDLVLQASVSDTSSATYHDPALAREQAAEEGSNGPRMQLEACAMALIRIMMKGNMLPHHQILSIIVPLNSLDRYGFTVHASTSAQNLIRNYFNKIKREQSSDVADYLKLPRTTWEEVRALELDRQGAAALVDEKWVPEQVQLDYESIALRAHLKKITRSIL